MVKRKDEKCAYWIFIDGGNDTAVCNKESNHEGKHYAYGVGEWTNENTEMAEKWLKEW